MCVPEPRAVGLAVSPVGWDLIGMSWSYSISHTVHDSLIMVGKCHIHKATFSAQIYLC